VRCLRDAAEVLGVPSLADFGWVLGGWRAEFGEERLTGCKRNEFGSMGKSDDVRRWCLKILRLIR